VAAVEDEWEQYYGAYWPAHVGVRDSVVSAARALWDRQLAPSLAPFLAAEGLSGGVVLLSPAVGFDGRIFAGRPQDPGDNVVVVHLPTDRAAVGATFAAAVVKELCAPLASSLVARAGAGSRAAAETASGRLAVRCGERLLARYAPGWVAGYRRVSLEALGAADVTPAEFERMFPADSALLRALERRLR
jgi:hypothetical protein